VLLKRHGISSGEFAKITSSMADLCFDILVRMCIHCRNFQCAPAHVPPCAHDSELSSAHIVSRVSPRQSRRDQTMLTTDSQGACQALCVIQWSVPS
jgi:BAFF-R, TALL-1 binding